MFNPIDHAAGTVISMVLAGLGFTVAPDALASYQDQAEASALISSCSSYGNAVFEESLLSDSGDELPARLTVTPDGRIAELPSVASVGSFPDVRYTITGQRFVINVVANSGRWCSFDSDTGQAVLHDIEVAV